MNSNEDKIIKIHENFKKKRLKYIIVCILFNIFADAGLIILKEDLGIPLLIIIMLITTLGSVTVLISEIKKSKISEIKEEERLKKSIQTQKNP